jgi:hypothetical protein
MAHGQTTARRQTTRGREKPRAGAARTVGTSGARSRAKRVAKPAPFKMRFLLIHPNADPGDISREIGLLPLRAWRCGEPRFTPKGTRLEGVWRDTRWSHGFELDENATIETAIASALERLATAGRYLATLRETGGTAELIVSLAGDAQQGASVGVETVRALADLGVSLGIEVFPKTSG